MEDSWKYFKHPQDLKLDRNATAYFPALYKGLLKTWLG